MNTLLEKLQNSIACLNNNKYAIAVSGGSDSLALLHLCAEFSNNKFVVIHFDHAVREESSQEADFVEQTAKQLGFIFEKHIWIDSEKEKCSGNFYQNARTARYKFFKTICDKYNLDGVLVAHSKTDLAETLLMRLSKGASVKGLSIFPQGKKLFGVKIYRPLLDFSRKDLQEYLRSKNIEWKVDPSNKDQNKMRPRIRAILPKLEEIGLSLTGFNKATEYFNQANQAFDYYTKKELSNFNKSTLGYYSISLNEFLEKPLEMQIRLINYIIEKYNSEVIHLPRRKNIIELINRIATNKTTIEPLDAIFIEIVNSTLFIYANDNFYTPEKTEKNIIKLQDFDKKTRYNIVKHFELQFLPLCIRNRVIFIMPKNSALNNIHPGDLTCLNK